MANANPSDDDNDFTSSPLIVFHESRRTYLVTYSRADMVSFPNFDSFEKCVLEAFKQGKSTARIVRWAVYLENQSDREHKHFHIAIKLSDTRRWYGVFK